MNVRQFTIVASVAAIVILLWFCLVPGSRSNRNEMDFDHLFGVGGRKVVEEAERFEAFTLQPLTASVNWQNAKLSDFKARDKSALESKDLTRRIATALLDPNSYRPKGGSAKACIPQYGVKLSFSRANDRVDVLLCFECDIMATFRNGAGEMESGQSFDDGRAELLRLVKLLFPDDRLIQSIKESRG